MSGTPFDPLCILTPSRITTAERYRLASASLASLRGMAGLEAVCHIVVHDGPAWRRLVPAPLRNGFTSLRWDARAEALYRAPATVWLAGTGSGSAAALLAATDAALERGKTFGFIHLDDHVYCEPFGELITAGLEAMSVDDDLLWTRFSGYPIMYEGRSAILPDEYDRVAFDRVVLEPRRTERFTLWRAPLADTVNEGRYWPIALWFCVFRLEFLRLLLVWGLEQNARHLAHVEAFYKEQNGFSRVTRAFPQGAFGYINMQYGGFEMHRNPLWRQLISGDNRAVR